MSIQDGYGPFDNGGKSLGRTFPSSRAELLAKTLECKLDSERVFDQVYKVERFLIFTPTGNRAAMPSDLACRALEQACLPLNILEYCRLKGRSTSSIDTDA